MRTLTAGLAAIALLAAPTSARERRHHHRDKQDEVGAFVAGALIAGGLVALLSAKKKAADAPLPELTFEEGEAANRCADAAERQMGDNGHEARVERFNAVTPRAKGGHSIKGAMRVTDAGDSYAMRFSCTVKHGEVRSVTLSI